MKWFSWTWCGLMFVAAVALGQPAGPQTAQVRGVGYVFLKNCPREQYNLSVDVPLPAQTTKPLNLLFAFQDADNHYRLALAADGATLYRVKEGAESVLAAAKGQILSPSGSQKVLFKRRKHFLTVALDLPAPSEARQAGSQVEATRREDSHRALLEALDASFHAGPVGLEVSGPLPKLSPPRFQPYADLHEGDDFMRPPDQAEASADLGRWQKVRGDWRYHSVMEEVKRELGRDLRPERGPQAERSANPFSLEGKSADWGLVTFGYDAETRCDFWDDYEFSVSAKSAGGAFGIAFYYKSDSDHFLLRWEAP
ncbi:MAG: hypothetical protein FJ279_14350, partial [Planctomycetes bacterium]|nr:hypothetical protein [Planctomycetota bacterium]